MIQLRDEQIFYLLRKPGKIIKVDDPTKWEGFERWGPIAVPESETSIPEKDEVLLDIPRTVVVDLKEAEGQ